MIWIGFSLMTLTAVMFAVWPILGKRGFKVETEDGASAVLIDQLEEVQRDLDRGLISADEASAAQLEIKRRILRLSRKTDHSKPRQQGDGHTSIALAALFIPVFAVGYYAIKGAPDIPSLAFAERQADQAQEQEIGDLAQGLLNRLTNDPNGGPSDGWMLLGQTYMRLGKYGDAVQAFEIAANRGDASSATWSRLGEALIMEAQGVVMPRAKAAIDKSLDLDSTNPAATFYKARSLEQAGDASGAHVLLVSRLNEADNFAPWMESFVAEANRIGAKVGISPIRLPNFAPMVGPGPSADDVAAAGDMTEEDRAAFIRSMVDRLASRMEGAPEDLEGWLRLANAYSVLGETEKAISAYENARDLLKDTPENEPRRLNVERALSDLKQLRP